MALTLREWLKSKFDPMVSIQTSILTQNDADLLVLAWSGAQMRVHLIGEDLRIRSIRRVLQEATEIGVNSLFLVDANLLPGDGQRATPKDWMQALHALTYERLYAFRVHHGAAQVIPVHFEEISGSTENKIWYGPAIPFDHIRFYKTSVKQPRTIRGEWLVADFGSHAFWRNTDYRNYQYLRDQEWLKQRQTHWQSYSAGQTWANNGSESSSQNPPTSPLQQHLNDCYRLLGVDENSSQDEVKRAFRKNALSVHPDTSGLPTEEAEAAFVQLSKAYDYIKAAKGWS